MRAIFIWFAVFGYGLMSFADGKSSAKENLVWNMLASNIIGKTPDQVKVALKERGLSEEITPHTCTSGQQSRCKEKYLGYCSCIYFSDNMAGKSLEARTYTAAVRDGKIVDYRMASALIPADVWFKSKEVVAPLQLNAFAKGKKPRNVHFDEVIPFGDRVPVVKDPTQVGRFLAQWTIGGNTEVAAVIWCPIRPGKGFTGKLRDCFVQEASFTSIGGFSIPKGTKDYAY